jgi:muramoyltetrapeptide carboxypeptidase
MRSAPHSIDPSPHPSRRIYVYSPSGAVRDHASFHRGIDALRSIGHQVEIDRDALARHQRFAGDDATRAAAIGRAAASGADVALMSRGGYGITRILPTLDYRALERSIAHGTQFVGLSDFTALQAALLARTGAASWAGPALLDDFGRDAQPDSSMLASFDRLSQRRAQCVEWSTSPDEGPAPVDLEVPAAPVWGGNLTVLSALIGTPYLPAVEGGILFFEDVNEHPYRVERMLIQWLQAGILSRQRALVFGRFTDYRLSPHDDGFDLPATLRWLAEQVRVPIITGLPFGHVAAKVVLPFGKRATLSVSAGAARLAWTPDA